MRGVAMLRCNHATSRHVQLGAPAAHRPTQTKNNELRWLRSRRSDHLVAHCSSEDEAYQHGSVDSVDLEFALPAGAVHSQVTIQYAGSKELTLETGEIGRLAGGSIMLTAGETMIYSNSCADRNPMQGGFTPLQVSYHERLSAGGRTAGGFLKRDGRPREPETLTSRLVDRPIRPLFPAGWNYDTQVLQWVMSYDPDNSPQPHAITGAAACLLISDIPFTRAVAGVRIALVDGTFIVNPTAEEMEASALEVVIAGTESAILMIEGFANFVSEDTMLEALEVGHKAIAEICVQMAGWASGVAKEKRATLPDVPQWIAESISEADAGSFAEAYRTAKKQERGALVQAAKTAIKEKVQEEFERQEVPNEHVDAALKAQERAAMRDLIVRESVRPDGRAPSTVRPIACRASVLPRVHGSALFTRGETQVLATATLGNVGAAQYGETLEQERDESRQHFYLQYFFPPSSVGETGRVGGAGRREIGHGKLAERSLAPAVEDLDGFPYVTRVESHVTDSNGSSSMASVCGACLAMEDAGVPLRRRVAGVAMGLILDDDAPEGAVILTDIMGVEDALGDMDFKVAGDADSISALQMDIKVEGITIATMRRALTAAREARQSILAEMEACRPAPRRALSKYCPRILEQPVPESKIGSLIGAGGKQINYLREKFALPDVEISRELSAVHVTCTEAELPRAQALMEYIREFLKGIEVGRTYKQCKVLQARDIGAVVELPGGHDALVHISELSMEPVEKTQDAVNVGDLVDIFIISSSSNSTRASIAAVERIKKGLPAVLERKRRTDGNGGSRGGRDGVRGRSRDGGRGRGGGRSLQAAPKRPRPSSSNSSSSAAASNSTIEEVTSSPTGV
eukprot:jgi/Ulvmu1/12186/UM085_0050.1